MLMKKEKYRFVSSMFSYIKTHKLISVFVLTLVLLGMITISSTFSFFSGTGVSRILNGRFLNFENAKSNFKYYVYNSDESDYILSYVEPVDAYNKGLYSFNKTLSTCMVRDNMYSSNWKELYESGMDLIELCKEATIYYDLVGNYSSSDIVVSLIKELKGTTCGNNCGEASTNQSLESLFQEGYTIDYTNSSCTNNALFTVDYKNAVINVTLPGTTQSLPETTCTIKLLKDSDFAATLKAANPPANTSSSLENNSGAIDDEGLITTVDDYGTTYYFRGNVQDNYFYFSGRMWRIIRINGDGSVRIMADNSQLSSAYNSSDNTYYLRLISSNSGSRGTLSGTMTSAQSMVTTVYSMFVASANEKYVSDRTIFCSDADLYSSSDRTTRTYGLNANYSSGAPVPTKYYGEDLSMPNQLNLKCPSVRDLFSKNIIKDRAYHDVNTIYEEGTSLSKPISFISAKESILAGNIVGTANPRSYLASYTSWTTSPAFYSASGGVNLYKIVQGGMVNTERMTTNLAVLPVISINPGLPVSGQGTSACPYEITEIRTYNC